MRARSFWALQLWALRTGLALTLITAPTLARAEPARLAILPIVVHSAERDPNYVSLGLVEMITARLEQTGELRVVRAAEGIGATTELAPVLEAGRGAGADYVLFGTFTQFGDGASLDIHCAPLDATAGEGARRVFIQSGSISEIIPRLDELVGRITQYVRGGPPVAGLESPAAAEIGDPLRELRERIDALEQAVYRSLPDDASAAAAESAVEERPES